MGVLSWFLGIVALWSLAILAFERYFVICRPLKNVRLGVKHAAMGLVFVWTFSFIWTIPPVLGWNSYTVSKIGTTCEPNWWVKNTVSLNLHSFIHTFCLSITWSSLAHSLSFSVCHGHVWREQHPQLHSMTLFMNTNVPSTCSLKWHHLELDKEFKSRLLPVCYIVTVRRKLFINPRLMPCSHQLNNCFQETGTKHLWLWLGLGLGTQTVHKLLNKECTLTQRRPRMGNIFTVVGHSCVHVDVQ